MEIKKNKCSTQNVVERSTLWHFPSGTRDLDESSQQSVMKASFEPMGLVSMAHALVWRPDLSVPIAWSVSLV